MNRFIRALTVGLISVASTAALHAAPLPPMQPVTIEGTIAKLQWSPDTPVKGRPGFSGSLGVDRTIPAQLRITLVDFRGIEADLAWRINGIMSDPAPPDADRAKLPAHLIVQLDNKDPHALVPGMRIRVHDYDVRGDEGGTWTRFTKLEILAQPAADQQGSVHDLRRWDFVILIDFSGFGMGRKIYLRRDGTCYLQAIDRSMGEVRYEFRVPPEELQEIERLLVKHCFWNIKTDERRGYLDEGKSSVIVHLDTGESREVEKWSADKHPDFDPIYERLRGLRQFTNEKNQVYEGARDFQWRPSGFEISAKPAKDAGAKDTTVNKKRLR